MLASAGAGLGVLVIIYLIIGVLSVIAWVKILNKAGYSGWWVLISLVPIVNFVMFLVFAFSDWPSQRQQGGGYGPPPGGASTWSPSPPPSGGYLPPPAGGYPPAAPGNYPPPQAPPPPPFGGGMA
jgi:hypothetical protein